MIRVSQIVDDKVVANIELTRSRFHYRALNSRTVSELEHYVDCDRLFSWVETEPNNLVEFINDLRMYAYVVFIYTQRTSHPKVKLGNFWINALFEGVHWDPSVEMSFHAIRLNLNTCLAKLSDSEIWRFLRVCQPVSKILLTPFTPFPPSPEEHELLNKMCAYGEENSETINLKSYISTSSKWLITVIPPILARLTKADKLKTILVEIWETPSRNSNTVEKLFELDKIYQKLSGQSTFDVSFNNEIPRVKMSDRVDDFIDNLRLHLNNDDNLHRILRTILRRYTLPIGYPQEVYNRKHKKYILRKFKKYEEFKNEIGHQEEEQKRDSACSAYAQQDCGLCKDTDPFLDPQDRCLAMCSFHDSKQMSAGIHGQQQILQTA